MNKLGKRTKRFDPKGRTLQLRNYVEAPAPSTARPVRMISIETLITTGVCLSVKKSLAAPLPKKKDWLSGIPSIPMYDNDTLGCCVIARMAHQLDLWSYLTTGKIIGFTDAQIISMYSAIGGYVPGDPSTDNGCDMLTAMNYWRKNGFAGQKDLAIEAFIEVNPMNPVEFAWGISWFGSTAIGLQLPTAIQTLNDWPAPPNLTGDWTPGSWGGHDVPAGAYFPGAQIVETWGATIVMSDLFFKSYCDEMYIVFFPDWVMADGVSPSGLNMAQLKADLAAL
jgi:hypothetical protein